MAAGIANLALTDAEDFYPQLQAKTQQLADGIRACAQRHGVPVVVNQVCGMLGLFFTEADRVDDFAAVQRCDTARYGQFFHAVLDAGVYLAPSAFETLFVSAAHGEAEISTTLEVFDKAFTGLC